jgi:hypothetical protein
MRAPGLPRTATVFQRYLLVPALALLLARSLAVFAAVVADELRRPPAERKPRMQEDIHFAAVLERARMTIPASAPVAVYPRQSPHLFAYYLLPRAIYSAPDLDPRAPFRHPLLQARGVRWAVGAKIRSR